MKLVKGAAFQFSFPERFSPDVVTEFNKGSAVRLGKRVSVHSGCKLKVRNGAILRIGNGVKINYYCLVICRKEIQIGDGTEFGPNVCIYDHDHDFRAGLKQGKYKSESIQIGKNCWIGANTVILRGTKIGDNCVVGAGSVIKGCYPDNSRILQLRETDVTPILHGEDS